MNGKDFSEVVELIVKEDPRYNKGAYYFVRKALDYTLKGFRGKVRKKSNHVSGGELLDGIREYALDQFGPMTLTLFDHWGIQECTDFGEIVFNLVEYGVFGKTENDNKEDFELKYSFHEAFAEPFLPERLKRAYERGRSENKERGSSAEELRG